MPSGSRRPHDRHPDPSTPAPTPPRTRRGGRSRETVLFLVAIALIALHVLNDNFLQPQPGTSASDHLVSGLVPLAVLGLVAWAYPRLRGGRRGALALLFGALGVLGGIEAVHYTGAVGTSGDDYTGLRSIPAGLLLLGLGAVTLWRTRRTEGSLLATSRSSTGSGAPCFRGSSRSWPTRRCFSRDRDSPPAFPPPTPAADTSMPTTRTPDYKDAIAEAVAAARNTDPATDLYARVVATAAWGANRAARDVWVATDAKRDPRSLVNEAFDVVSD